MNKIRIFLTFLALSISAFVFAGPVDINIADVQTLAKNIKGVGAKKAAAIIAYREQHGKFQKADDIVKVKGIGIKLLEKNRDIIVVNLD